LHVKTLEKLRHSHDFAAIHRKGEKQTLRVLILTSVTMIIEIIAGLLSGSMALLADGWHMGTHVAAFMIAIFAYRFARKHANNPEFTFGTGKVGILGGFASAVALAVIALAMSVESIQRMITPQNIHFNEAIAVAVFGLFINIVCAYLLRDSHDHAREHKHHHHDHNLKAAYMHVLADVLTSLLAIIALLSGKLLGWHTLDPLMGIAGAVVITSWSYSLLKETGPILLDSGNEMASKSEIKTAIESDSDNRISDIHLWKIGPDDYAAIISIVTHFPKPTQHYKNLLKNFHEVTHITIEINKCEGEPCLVPGQK
jgi:cation diffusion facilitator family transporter